MRWLGAVAIIGLACAGCRGKKEALPEADTSTRRTTPSGEVVGFRSPYGSDAWFGLPYAKPPVAELRWRAPQPADPWTGLRPALAHGSPCTQYASAMGGGAEGKTGHAAGSEDCLYLSVWAPHAADGKAPAGAPLPVMVWIHGGGNTIGQGGFYDGGNLAATENVVVVAINYRLGPFGWFRHPALRQAGTSDADRSGNYGTLDIIRALQWVHENITAFGGNPGNVTVFGESAGGANVYTMLLSPLARGLFQRAVVESGGLYFESVARAENFADADPPGDKNSSNEVLLRQLIKDGKASDRAGAKKALESMNPEEVAVYLRGKTAEEILTIYEPSSAFGMFDMPRLFAEGVVIPTEAPLDLLARRDGHNAVPTIIGTNKDENKLFMMGDPNQVHWILWVAPRVRDEHMYNLTAEYLAKMWKATGADQPAAAMRKSQDDVYVYRFDWDEEPTLLGGDLSVLLGAAHAFEVPFVFGHFDLGGRGNVIYTKENEPGRKQLSGEMMSYWAEFARSGVPGSGGGKKTLPAWTPAPSFMVLDTDAGGGLHMSPDTVTADGVLAAVGTDTRLADAKQRCTVWRALANWSRGGFGKEQYAAKEECRAYPFDAFPWS